MTESWVLSQQRTMARWVSSKITQEIHDISVDLCDGLALLELVNAIAIETKASPYRLTPIHRRPKIPLQKLENVADVLEFCRLLLQVNTCNISAEDVVCGNTKLILGLIWSLFVYSLANMVSVKSESKSFAEIKCILLRWLNITGKAKALPQITNFNTDWSLQQDKRPDLVFAAILDFYVPNVVDYKKLLTGKRLSGLGEIIALADASLGIPDLALAEDFNVLVPDDKCILFYVLEWYLFFEIHKRETHLDLKGSSEVSKTVNHDFGPFFSTVIRAFRLKNMYDTKSLRLLNRINASFRELEDWLELLETLDKTANLVSFFDQFCAEIDDTKDLESQLSAREYSNEIEAHVKCLQNALSKSMKFKRQLKPEIMYRDIPELRNLSKNLDSELKIGGFRYPYDPMKALSLDCLLMKLRLLLEADARFTDLINNFLAKLFETSVRNIDEFISYMAKSLPKANKHVSEAAHKFAAGLELLLELRNNMHEYQLIEKQEHTTSDLKILAESIAFYDLPATPTTPKDSQFQLFQAEVDKQTNRANLTLVDLKKFLQKLMPSSQFNGPELQGIILLVPSRCFLPRSESNDFNTVVHMDDSDDPDSVFDNALKTLECKLLGAQGRIYDLTLLVQRMESGFNI
ncbi:hypothetical protein METBIDRAFT_131228 [Metschnikowia bicuspidata var. bicuspidata NRRL YB-4993]|uniref:Calponin-homology (CH) domain-containing protein n=1 Tax=Metschnikowia bicuspidata var. bicuspidata NRRL YB-4993 TaxID=869754 RepID=A0A1A0HKC4_9ASCO|nr:hypothetical protein METBIDRAFT_131228 [Metschnikowia bicuspidata var. bicuspidata NRRL YB-4993]OBA24337.1 hypothetical protein METBIDRAFT_131228 [Metschnikowia bicuspidata var. bicuspidata NRRL YB-4993]